MVSDGWYKIIEGEKRWELTSGSKRTRVFYRYADLGPLIPAKSANIPRRPLIHSDGPWNLDRFLCEGSEPLVQVSHFNLSGAIDYVDVIGTEENGAEVTR